jgi:long-chain acyl-CoA synthetase
MPGVRLSLENTDGKIVAQGEEGEIVISGPTVSVGYWSSQDQELLQNQTLRTGDIGWQDEDGNLYISGRLKDQINIGGYKVYPGEIEAVLSSYTQLDDCAVCSVIEGSSESIFAAVVCSDGVDIDGAYKHCASMLEQWKVPTRIFRLDKLPRTNTGKLKRQELASILAEMIND